jgi:hypothetical protein
VVGTKERESLIRRGYVLVPAVLDAPSVARLRDACWEFFSRTKRDDMLPSEFLAVPEIAAVPFSETVVSVLKRLLGDDYTTLPDFNMQTNKYGCWHRDNGSEGPAGYLYAPDYLFVKVGIPLQDNTADLGGGIDLVPWGHRLRFRDPQSIFSRALRLAFFKVFPKVRVPSRAGDLICFDSRIYHQSTHPSGVGPRRMLSSRIVLDLPRDRAKHILYWDASRTNAAVDYFIQNGLRRAKSESFHADAWSVRFPDNYSPQVLARIRAAGVRVASAKDLGVTSMLPPDRL